MMVVAVLIDIFAWIKKDGWDTAILWMDAAAYWRNYSFLGALIQEIAAKHMVHVILNFGYEQHFKMIVDGSLLPAGN